MIQIIGFMGCLYFVIKALEISARADSRPDGKLSESAMLAIVLSTMGAIGFTLWLVRQGGELAEAVHPPSELSQAQIDCINAAKSSAEILACR